MSKIKTKRAENKLRLLIKKKKNRLPVNVKIKPAKYLTPVQVNEAKNLSVSLRKAKDVSAIEYYEKQLKRIRKAYVNKQARNYAKELIEMEKEDLMRKYKPQ